MGEDQDGGAVTVSSDEREFVEAFERATTAGLRAKEILITIRSIRASVIAARYDPTIVLTPDLRFQFRRIRRVLPTVI